MVGVILLVFTLLYNHLVRMRNRVDNAWRQIDVQLQRRHDLIPVLERIVEGYAAHEKQALARAAAARAATDRTGGPVDRAGPENGLTAAITGLLAVAERYPGLRADREFAELIDELSHTETAIAGSRKYYNGTVMQYNNTRQSFPGNIVAAVFRNRFAVRDYFEIEDPQDRLAPSAKMPGPGGA
mgnify:CR=1 FL=1